MRPVSDPRVAELNEALESVEIRDPVRSLLSPRLEFVKRGDEVHLVVYIKTYHAKTGDTLDGFSASFPITDYLAGRYVRKKRDLASFACRCVRDFFWHELEESVFLDGEPAFQPTHWGPSAEDMERIRA